MTESNGSILIYGSITYLVETNSTNELGLITPEKEISFNLTKQPLWNSKWSWTHESKRWREDSYNK